MKFKISNEHIILLLLLLLLLAYIVFFINYHLYYKMSSQEQAESTPISMYESDKEDIVDISERKNCTCDAGYMSSENFEGCEGCEGCEAYENCDACNICYENKKNDLIYEKIEQLIEENINLESPQIQSNEEIYFIVRNWLEQNEIIDLPFNFKRYLDEKFYGKSGSLDIDAYGRHEQDDIINIHGTRMRVLDVGIFTFEARDVNYLALREFISKKMKYIHSIDPESMYNNVSNWKKKNHVNGISFSDMCSLDFEFYNKGGGINMDAYGRPTEGDRINFHGFEMIVRNTGMFTFDIEKYVDK